MAYLRLKNDGRWGKLVGIHFMNVRGVAIYDYDLLKDIYGRKEASGRPHNFVYQQRMGGGNHGETPKKFAT